MLFFIFQAIRTLDSRQVSLVSRVNQIVLSSDDIFCRSDKWGEWMKLATWQGSFLSSEPGHKCLMTFFSHSGQYLFCGLYLLKNVIFRPFASYQLVKCRKKSRARNKIKLIIYGISDGSMLSKICNVFCKHRVKLFQNIL